MKRRDFLGVMTAGAGGALLASCSYKLSLNGASIPNDLKTINIEYFENNAQLVVATLSQQFTEALKNRIRTQTSLSIVRGEANATMSGAITGYSIAPVAVQASNPNTPPIANASQLSITVHVKYDYPANKKLSFDESFSKALPFTGDISSREQALIPVIIKQLTDDIFNRAFASW